MADSFEEILAAIDQATAEGKLLKSTARNIRSFLIEGKQWEAVNFPDRVALESIHELIEKSAWIELNDRFFKTLAFGTGGLRGRTIGKIVTGAERGRAGKSDPAEFPCVGTNAMNFYNVSRATG